MSALETILRLTSPIGIGLSSIGVAIVGGVSGVNLPVSLRATVGSIGILTASFALMLNTTRFVREGKFTPVGETLSGLTNVAAVLLFVTLTIGVLAATLTSTTDQAKKLEEALARYVESAGTKSPADRIQMSYSVYGICARVGEIKDSSLRNLIQARCERLLGKPITTGDAEEFLLTIRQVTR